jgi:HSP20 family molecular chaperone IbpA
MSATLEKREQNNVASAEQNRNGVTYSPRIDICETDHELVLFADLPGVRSEDLDIRYENRELTIHGKVQPRNEDVKFLYAEYGVGDFYRTFTVGEMIDAEKIAAELHNGVLTLHLPKTEKVKPRRIEVK